jgi:hypothetical protein
LSISRIQVAGNANASSNSINVTLSGSNVGDLIIVWGSTGGNSVSTFTISDNGGGGGNTYTPVTGYANVDLSGGNHSETDWFGYTIDTKGGITSVTVAHNSAGGSTFGTVGIYRSTNGWPGSPVDKSVKGTYATSQTSFSSGSTGTLSQASEVAIGFMQFTFDPGTPSGLNGFTQQDLSAFLDTRRHFFSDKIVSSTAALTLTATVTSSDSVANVVTFNDNAGGGATDSEAPTIYFV